PATRCPTSPPSRGVPPSSPRRRTAERRHGYHRHMGVGGLRALVTGAGGFIGGHLTARLVGEGAPVRAFVRYNSRTDHRAPDWLPPDLAGEIDVVSGDLRDLESIEAAMADVEAVFHLGAQIAIPYSYVNPRDFFETNVLGTLNVAQAALRAGVLRV